MLHCRRAALHARDVRLRPLREAAIVILSRMKALVLGARHHLKVALIVVRPIAIPVMHNLIGP
jgi:hypothetical protein